MACGSEGFRDATSALGLEITEAHPEVVLVDAHDVGAVARSLVAARAIPRIFVAEGALADLLRAAGAPYVLAPPLTATALGPLVHALERGVVRRPRTIVCCAASGATGRTSLVANLAVRLARRFPVVALDATGTGGLAWRLGAAVSSWTDLAAVGADLAEAHLRLAAAEREGVLVLGGVGEPDRELLLRVVDLSRGLGVVLLDAPASMEPFLERADRMMVCANPDPASAAATAALLARLGALEAQLIVSQAEERDSAALGALFGRAPTFVLPRDERSCRDAVASRRPMGGRLGRAYDAIAEILAAELAT